MPDLKAEKDKTCVKKATYLQPIMHLAFAVTNHALNKWVKMLTVFSVFLKYFSVIFIVK